MPITAPYGSWESPVDAALLVERAVGLADVVADGDDLLWIEGRPAEGGRQALVRLAGAGPAADVLPAPWSVRSLVHEYGGLCYAARNGTVVFSNFADQRLWRLDPGASDPVPLTAEPAEPRAVRFADPVPTPDGGWVVCVRERHGSGAVVNDLVAVATDGSQALEVLVSGHDFVAAPRLSPDGRQLAWLTWELPDMPWDATRLWVAELAARAPTGAPRLGPPRQVAGGAAESVGQPRWSPAGELHWVSDRSGWWNLCTERGPLAPMDAEFAGPDWVFGQASYAFVGDTLVASWSEGGRGHLGVVAGGSVHRLPLPFTEYTSVRPAGGGVAAVAGSPTEPASVVRIGIPGGGVEVLRRSREVALDPEDLSVPEAVEFPTGGGLTSHALFYAPTNRRFEAPAGERPPLIVMSHGGPTSAARAVLDLRVQYWTSRGFAVADVDYGGSTGYGRPYRERLAGQWGVVDVDDCVNAARYLAARGDVDGDRLVIRGGSAGGYTTLAALTFRDAFAAGASHYGVADLELLARDTHKFESRYLDKLVGPYPEAREVYRARSPLHHVELLSTPVIVFQGLEDAVVPPEQSEAIVAALRDRGVPVAYLAFEGEQHGFRRAETIVRVAEAELSFYGRVLGFTPAGGGAPVPMENSGSRSG